MAEWSFPHTAGVGDGTAYSASQFADILKILNDLPAANEAVFPGQLSELAVSSIGANNVRVASGNALVDGWLYLNDANVDITVTSPAVGTTGFLVALRYSASARTVRAVAKKNTDGTATIPAVTQTDNVTWEVPLASGTITTGGAISALTDLRQYVPQGLGDLDGVDVAGVVAGKVLTYDGTGWIDDTPAGAVFGDGSDGNVTIASLTAMTRDMYYDTLTVNAGQTLDTDGFRIFCRTAVIVNGTITNLPGTTTNAHLAGPAGTLGAGGNGAIPSSGSSRAGAGGPVILVAAPTITGSGVIHADGNASSYAGTGGLGTTLAAAGVATSPAEVDGGSRIVRSIHHALAGRMLDGTKFNGGSGGGVGSSAAGTNGVAVSNALGGAGGAAVASSVSGGGGGAAIAITAVPTTTTIRANGGNGGGPGGVAGAAGIALNLMLG